MERHPDIREAAGAAGLDVEFTTEAVLDAMADTVTPQGIVAVARQSPDVAPRRLRRRRPTLIAICEEVRDPGNLGTIIRAADAAGADAVVLTGRTVDLYNPKVVRATTGSLFHLPVAVGADLAAAVERAHGAGLRVIAADVGGADFLGHRAILAEPTAWLFGNEARGLDDEALAFADLSLRLPIYGSRRVAQSRHGGERVPLRERLRAARRRGRLTGRPLLQVGKGRRKALAEHPAAAPRVPLWRHSTIRLRKRRTSTCDAAIPSS